MRPCRAFDAGYEAAEAAFPSKAQTRRLACSLFLSIACGPGPISCFFSCEQGADSLVGHVLSSQEGEGVCLRLDKWRMRGGRR